MRKRSLRISAPPSRKNGGECVCRMMAWPRFSWWAKKNDSSSRVVEETRPIAANPAEPEEGKKGGDGGSEKQRRAAVLSTGLRRLTICMFSSAARSCLQRCTRGRAEQEVTSDPPLRDISEPSRRERLRRENRVGRWKEEAECVSLSESLCGRVEERPDK